MKRDRGWVVRGAMAAVVCGVMLGGGAARAQAAAGAELRQQLQELAQNPQSVEQLVGTGRAALQVGDAEAAVGFFTRALEIAPSDPRAKAGLAAATAQTGQPESALVLFGEAVQAGASEAEIAGDRGLAYDLTGQTARAQADYTLALRRAEDPEVRRRLALSLAISGQREAALRLLDPQVRSGDRAAGRARAMVLALGGDVPGATGAAQSAMPPGGAQAMTPFFTRLASLSPAQKAAAVNLGRIPAAGGAAYADAGRTNADPGALAFAGSSAASSMRPLVRNPVEDPEGGDRRRPGGSEPVRVAAATEAGRPRGTWPGATGGTAVTLPHPGQPLEGAMRGVVAAAPNPVEQEEAADPTPFGGVVASASRQPSYSPAQQPDASSGALSINDSAAANLAVWNRAGPVTPAPSGPAYTPRATSTPRLIAERPVAAPVRTRPRASFSEVASNVTALDAAREAAPTRSRYRRSWRNQSALTASVPAETATDTSSRYRSRGRRYGRGLTGPAAAIVDTAPSTYSSRGRRHDRGLTSPATSGGASASANSARNRRGSRGLTSTTITTTTSSRDGNAGASGRRGRGGTALTSPSTSSAVRGSGSTTRTGRAAGVGTRTSGYGASGRSGRAGTTNAITANTRNGSRGATTTTSSTRRGVTSATTGRGAASTGVSARSATARGATSGRTAMTTSARTGRGATPAITSTSSRRTTPTTTTNRRPRGR